ncbi:3693_t:CDS:2, partial [Racocetra persica]
MIGTEEGYESGTATFSMGHWFDGQTPLAKLIGTKRPTKPELEPCSANISVNYPFNKPGEKPKIYCQNHASQ